jgi:L-fuculose-phosphate aldolase
MTSTLRPRQQVVDLCLRLSERGYFAATGGNLALRVDAERFAVTPSATDYHTMSADDVCVLRLSDLKKLESDATPSVESTLHAHVLRKRPDVGCSIHTHQPVGSACALLGRDLAVPPDRQGLLGKRVPLVGYAPSGSSWLANRLKRSLAPDIHAYLMLNHGVLCCGAGIEEAMATLDALEALAREHLQARIASRAASEPQRRAALCRVIDVLAAQAQPTAHP